MSRRNSRVLVLTREAAAFFNRWRSAGSHAPHASRKRLVGKCISDGALAHRRRGATLTSKHISKASTQNDKAHDHNTCFFVDIYSADSVAENSSSFPVSFGITANSFRLELVYAVWQAQVPLRRK